jgi:hypothetical protein
VTIFGAIPVTMISIQRVISGEVKGRGTIHCTHFLGAARTAAYDNDDREDDDAESGEASILTGKIDDDDGDDEHDLDEDDDHDEIENDNTEAGSHVAADRSTASPKKKVGTMQHDNDNLSQKKREDKQNEGGGSEENGGRTTPPKIVEPSEKSIAVIPNTTTTKHRESVSTEIDHNQEKAAGTTANEQILSSHVSKHRNKDASRKKNSKTRVPSPKTETAILRHSTLEVTQGVVADEEKLGDDDDEETIIFEPIDQQQTTLHPMDQQTSLGFAEPPCCGVIDLLDVENCPGKTFDTEDDVSASLSASFSISRASVVTATQEEKVERGPEKPPVNPYYVCALVVVSVIVCFIIYAMSRLREEMGGVWLGGSSCSSAMVLESGASFVLWDTTNTTENMTTTIKGSDKNNNGPLCGELGSNDGPGRWYKLVGDGKVYQASTCGEETELDTQLSVFVGSCGSLTCVDGNDNYCNSQSQVTWFADPGIAYFLHISGFRGAIGAFELSIEPVVESNDQCQMSLDIDPLDHNRLFGSTIGLNGGISDGYLSCNDSDPKTTSGLWYTWIGTGATVAFSTCSSNDRTDYNAQLSVYSSSEVGNKTCAEDLHCVTNVVKRPEQCGDSLLGEMIQFESKVLVKYYILVHQHDPNAPADDATTSTIGGNFELTIQTTSTTNRDFETCAGSRDLSPGSVVVDRLQLHSLPDYDQGFHPLNSTISCGDAVLGASSPSVWYKIRGTGLPMTASTCDPLTSFDTQLTVLAAGRHTCQEDSLQCVAGIDQTPSCDVGDKAVVTWHTQKDVVYHLVVHGYGSRRGTFWLSLSEETIGSRRLLLRH